MPNAVGSGPIYAAADFACRSSSVAIVERLAGAALIAGAGLYLWRAGAREALPNKG